jgi:hypothetical protein
VNVLEHVGPVQAVHVQQNLGVAPRGKLDALAGQLIPQFHEVVNLAVERNGQPAIRGGHGLEGAVGIDYAQAAKPDGAAAIGGQEFSALIGAPMDKPAGHPARDVNARFGTWKDKFTSETAHGAIVQEATSQ